ncbi:MAG TPA: DUF1697 domain-containing protein [Thermoanaerobaculia bacterium]
MPTFIALLRAVNLGPRNKVAMADLRGLLTELGMEDPRTLLQSGNLVFRSNPSKTAELEGLLEVEAEARLGLKTDFFVRTAEEWRTVVQGNPFPEEAESDPGHLLVFALKEAPKPAAVKALQEAIRGREVVRGKGRHAYVVYPDGIGRSRLTNAVIEKHLGSRGTGRNWNTVLKLQALVEPS